MVDIFDHPGWAKPMLPERMEEPPKPWGRPWPSVRWPQPGFFLLRTPRAYDRMTGTTHRGAWIIPALIYRPCPWVQPDDMPYWPGAPDPDCWCRPTQRPRPLLAKIGGVDVHLGSSWGDPCSAVYQIWEWGRKITAAQYEDALHEYAAYQLR